MQQTTLPRGVDTIMRYAGIDIGSRTIELVIVEDGTIRESQQVETTFDPMVQIKKVLEGQRFDRIMATGYGRNLFEVRYDAVTVTEIKAYGRGARHLFPEVKTVLDIGGQDSKCIIIGPHGKVERFEMNDRCAAGTGKFLEIMAQALSYSIEDFGQAALSATQSLPINAMCTVFAESEVTSLISRGQARQDIARGLHQAVAIRAAGMIRRLWSAGPIFFAGGVAHNQCIRRLLEEEMQVPLIVPDTPQLVGALGAALLLAEGG